MSIFPKRTKMVLAYDVTIDGTRFVVHQPIGSSWGNAYEGWQMTVGGKRVKVLRVNRMRDGGTTLIRTNRGELTIPQTAFPDPLGPAEPRWDPS